MNASSILDRLDIIINRDDYSRSLGLAVLNECCKWIQNEGDWSFMEVLDESQVTADGTSNYSIPTRFKREIDVYLKSATGAITPLTEWRSTAIDRNQGNALTENMARSYFYFAGSLFLRPVPSDANYTIGQRCYCYIADLTDSTGSTNELTNNHANLLITMAAREIFNIFEDYDAAKIWHEGSGSRKDMCFKSEWDSFLKKEGKKQLSSTTQRMTMRVK